MKTQTIPNARASRHFSKTGVIAAAISLLSALSAQTTIITSDTTVLNPGPLPFQVVNLSGTRSYEIENGVTLTFKPDGSILNDRGGMWQIVNTVASNTTWFRIGPSTPGGSGWTVFQDCTPASTGVTMGGALSVQGLANAPVFVELENVSFLNNYISTAGASWGAAIYTLNIYSHVYITNGLFANNYSAGANTAGGAVVHNLGVFVMNGGTFFGNYATSGNIGVIGMSDNTTGMRLEITNVLFEQNRAAQRGGVTKSRTNNSGNYTMYFTDCTFIDNWSGNQGGVIWQDSPSNTGVVFTYTGSNGVTNYNITGNSAGYMSVNNGVSANEVRNNAPRSDTYAKASFGGFSYSSQASLTRFNIADGVTLTIGDASATNKAYDSIASGVNTARMFKEGPGTMILNADNSYYSGTFVVSAGRLLLGNDSAKLGGIVTVATGATFGGSGTLQTFDQSNAVLATTVNLANGAYLQVGVDGAPSGQRLAFTRTGDNTLNLAGGATLKFDLYGSTGADPSTHDQLIADKLIATGVNILDLTGLGNGTYTLISAASLTGGLSNFNFTINGGNLTARNTASLSLSGNNIMLQSTFANLSVAWTGADSALWTNVNIQSPNWTDGLANPERFFRTGDFVAFDSIADAATPANRTINVAPEGVTVSGMGVSGAGNYTFDGGALTINAASAQSGFTGATGKLVKDGTGALTLQNATSATTAANSFGIVEFNAGEIAFSSAAALGSGANDIRMTGDVTLRATNTADMTFADKLTLAVGKTLTFATDGATVTLAGDFSGFASTASLIKTGTGALQIAADYSAFAPAADIRVDTGALRLASPAAKLGGAITVASGATIGGTGDYTGSVVAQAGSILAPGGVPGATTGQTLNINSLTLQGVTLKFSIFDDNASDKLVIGNLATLAGTNTIDFNTFKTGTFTIATITAGDRAGLAAASITVAGRAQGGTRQFITLFSQGNDLLVDVFVDISRSMRWTGTAAATPTLWDMDASNWAGSNNVTTFATGDRITFDDSSPAATHAINLSAPLTIMSDMIVTGSANHSFTGGGIVGDADSVVTASGSANLTGATGKLIKNGSGTLTLANTEANDFKGGIDLDGGAIIFASAGASGTTAITVNAAAARIGAGIDGLVLVNDIAFAGAGGTLTFDTLGNSATLSGALTGACALAINGPGALTLSGSNDFAGNILLSGGTLGIGNHSALGAPDKTLLLNAASLQLLAANIDITQTIVATDGLLIDMTAATGTLSGNITGSAPFTKTGSGTLALTGSNPALAGSLAIAQGRLVATSPAAIGGGFSASGAGAIDIATGATLEYLAEPDAASGALSFARSLTGSGALAISLGKNTDTLSFATASTVSAFTGTLRIDRGTLTLDANAAAGLASPTSNLTIGSDAIVNKTAAITAINGLTLAGGRINLIPAATAPALTVSTLEIATGTSTIGIDPTGLTTSAGEQLNPAIPPDLSIFDQSNYGATVLVLVAGSVTGSGDLQLTTLDGAALPTATGAITQSGSTTATTGSVATAIFSYGAAARADGIYVGYGLSEIRINDGKILTLDNRDATSSTLNTALTGDGGVDISGTGVITLGKEGSYTGATTLTSGTVRASAANVFGQTSSLDIAAGTGLLLAGNNQTVGNLTSAVGTNINTGGATLTVVNTIDTTLSGSISGGGKLVKAGPGKLLLKTANAHASTDIAGGTLGVDIAGALGANSAAITVTGTGAALDIDVANYALGQAINMGTNGFLISANAGGTVAVTGNISGTSGLTLAGSGTYTLTGNNGFTGGLTVTAPRIVATSRNNNIGAGPVTLSPGSTLEYRGFSSGTVLANANTVNNAIIGGGGLEVVSSTMAFGGDNNLSRLHIRGASDITLTAGGVFGGPASVVEISGSSTLQLNTAGLIAQSLTVREGNTLVYNHLTPVVSSIKLEGPAIFENDTAILIRTSFTGERVLIETPEFVGLDNFLFDPGPNNTGFLDYREGKLRLTLINMAANPGKDIATIYDSMTASLKAVYSRISENFLTPLVEKQNGAWLKLVGSFADYSGDSTKIGFRERTHGMVLGYDRELGSGNIWGLYLGYNTIDIKTDNDSSTEGNLPYGGLYLGKRWESSVYAVADFMAGILTADTSRFEQIGYNIGTYRANVYGGTIEIGYVMNAWNNAVIRPSFAFHYLGAVYSNHEETGKSPFFVKDFKARRFEAFTSVQLAQKLTTPWKRPGYLDVSLGWRASLTNNQPKLTASFSRTYGDTFELDCDSYDRSGIVTGLGLRMAVGDLSTLGLYYDFEFTRNVNRHNINATLRWDW